MPTPLEGIRVLDFGVLYFAPIAGMMLADMGAEVIRVESVEGETMRWGGIPNVQQVGESQGASQVDHYRYMAVNRGKKCLSVDVRRPEGKEIIFKLLPQTDVILQNFRPGAMERLGLDYAAVSRVNPRIVYASLSGWGETGPLAHRYGGDQWTQAMAGVVALQGQADEHPYLSSVAFTDHGGAVMAAYGVVTALFARERTGVGQEVTGSLLDTSMFLQLVHIHEYLIEGKLPRKVGRCIAGNMPPYGAYRCKDGREVVTMFGMFDAQWPTFCQAMEVEHLVQDPRFASDTKRYENRSALYPLLDEAFAKKTAAEWQQIFRQYKMRADPCLDYQELVEHPQVAANEMIVQVKHPQRGTYRTLGIPIKLKKTPGRVQGPPPLLGQHTEEILGSLSYTSEEINRLEREGVVRTTRLRQEGAPGL